MSPFHMGRLIVSTIVLLSSLALVRPATASQYTINFEDASNVPTSATPSPLNISNTFGDAYIGDLVHGVVFSDNFSVYSTKYTNNVGGSNLYGATNGTFAITNTAGGGTADTGPGNPGLDALTFTTHDVLQGVSFAANDYGNGSFGAASVTVTAFNGSGDLASVSLSLMDTNSNPIRALTSLNTSQAFNPFAGVITGYRINRTVTDDYALFSGGGNYVADNFVFNTVPTMSSVSFNPSTVTSGANTTGTLTLSGPAPPVNAVVHLTSSNPAALYVPPTAQLNSGLTSRTFTAVSRTVSVATTVTVTATYNGTSQTATVTVNPVSVTMSSVSFSPSSVTGGTNTTGTLTLTGPAPPANAVVTLTSSNRAALYVPPTAQLNSGLTSRTFTAVSYSVNTVTNVTVTATYNGVSKTAVVKINPAIATGVASLSFSPTSVVGGANVTGTLTLNGVAPTGNAVVNLTSSNTAALYVPPTAQLNSGLSSRTFTAVSRTVTATKVVTVTATYNGVSKTATVTVTP